MDDFQPIFGRCECGSVRIRVDAPAKEMYHCHCSRCRHRHGTLFATFAFVQREHLKIEYGREDLSTYRSPVGHWHFCRNCGCHLLVESDQKPGGVWYMPATLEGGTLPGHPKETEKHIFVASKSPCETITDGLPQYDEAPDVKVDPGA